MKYTPRVVESKLEEYITFFSVVGLTGPRQSGKSTMLLNKFKSYRYISFDDLRVVEAFYDDPEKFMRVYSHHVIFDEVQKVPEIFNYVKILVDKDRSTTGKFILTGSSQFSLMKKISESLAGRIGLLSLLPYQYSETSDQHKDNSVFLGGYPELVEKNYALFSDWFASYMNTYVNTDVRALTNIGDLRDFNKLIHLLAVNATQQLNMSIYSKHLGVDVKTIKRWISILEASYIIFLLPPFYDNLGKRIVKAPKIYFYDTGMISYLVGIETRAHYEKGPMSGSIFENYIVSEIVKNETHKKTNSHLYYYRTSNGVEVDLILDRRCARRFIEIKHGETYHPRMIKPLESIVSEKDEAFLLYSGVSKNLSDKVNIMNYSEYFHHM